MKATFYARLCSFGIIACAGAALLMATSVQAQTLYVADQYSGAINKFDSAGNETNFVPSTELWAYQIAFDNAGDLFIGNNNGPGITKVTPNGIASSFGSGVSGPGGVAVNSAGNEFVADGGKGEIIEVSSNGSPETVFASGLSNPSNLTFNNAGDLFESD